MPDSDTYCFDTSALFDAGIRWYPPELFPTFWSELDKLIAHDRIVIPEMVAIEATHHTDSIGQWVSDRRISDPDIFASLTPDIQAELNNISKKYPEWTSKGRNKADPFVVATAKAKDLVVVTGEVPSGVSTIATPTKQRKLKIPNVCSNEGVPWIGITDLMKAEGWKF